MSEERTFNIAIDGPAGAGKSTIAKKVAAALSFIYVDTGAMYRAMALYMIREGLTREDAKDSAAFRAKVAEKCRDAHISIEYRDDEQIVLLNGENVGGLIRTAEVSAMASLTSAVPEVRERMTQLQKELAEQQNVVMDGRDIGTVVLPDAQLKIFLTASVEVRARRRYLENLERQKKGADVAPDDLDLEKISADIAERDRNDMTRAIAPLRQAEDAHLVDSSNLTVDQVAETILNLYAVKKNLPQVITAKTAGFCFGVQRAVDEAYDEARKAREGHSATYTFGPIIHNEIVVEDLRRKGVGVIDDEKELQGHEKDTVVIRSHGVSRELQTKISASAGRTVDATCTFVKRIHQIVEEAGKRGEQVVIIGNHGHAESEAHVGWAWPGAAARSASAHFIPAVIIETPEEAYAYDGDPAVPVCIVAQTTFNGERFDKLVAILRQRGYNTKITNTICNATRERQSEAREIASRADVMIVIGGKSSSNTAKLYEICKRECERTFFIQTVDDLSPDCIAGARVIGITAGASTPKNIIEEVQSYVRRTDF